MEYINLFLESTSLVDFLKNIKDRGVKQAYIFNSSDKIKNVCACEIFALILSCESNNSPCLKCANCQRILGGNHIDIMHYPKGKNIVVEDIEAIIDSCYILPAENEYKIYILNDFEFANISSQNKFLKTLENPPKNVIFLINTSNIEMILDTVKSRCEIINLPFLKNEEIKNILEKSNIDFDEFLLKCSNNELGKYLTLVSSDFISQYEFCLNMLENMNASSDILAYSSKILKQKKSLENFIVALTLLFENLLILSSNKKAQIQQKERIEKLLDKFSPMAIKTILQNLLKSNNELFYSTNENLVIDCLLLNILEERYKWK